MNTKTLSSRATNVIQQYLNFSISNAVCSVPYFNNKTARVRGALSVYVGKGSPKEIFEETETILIKAHVAKDSLTSETLHKLLVDNNIGIDCSGFAYYILNAESQENNKGSIDKHISFVQSRGLFGKISSSLHPVKNIGVLTFANDKNSRVVTLSEIQPGDMITMISADGTELPYTDGDRNHILIIHQIEYQNFIPYKIHYSHTVAYPEDGVYGSGIKQGIIEILDITKPVTSARWTENDKQGESNRIFMRANKSKTEIRRLGWLY